MSPQNLSSMTQLLWVRSTNELIPVSQKLEKPHSFRFFRPHVYHIGDIGTRKTEILTDIKNSNMYFLSF